MTERRSGFDVGYGAIYEGDEVIVAITGVPLRGQVKTVFQDGEAFVKFHSDFGHHSGGTYKWSQIRKA